MNEMIDEKWGRDEMMVIAAFRYCLGRRTFVSYYCDWLVTNWVNLQDGTRNAIQRELEDAFAASKYQNILGDDIDRKQWERVRALWRKDK